MGSKPSKFFSSIMDYNSLNGHIEGRERGLYQKKQPRPPRKRKREIYDPAKYKRLNEHIDNTPESLLNTDTKELVEYLTTACKDDLARVHALFYWVTSRSLFVTSRANAKKYSPIWYLNKIFTGHSNFAHFFYILCWHADIPCVIIGGITKNSAYKIGFPLVTADMTAQWNAVYVMDDWHLTNIQWACIYANEPNDWKRVVIVTEKEFSSKDNGSTNHASHFNIPCIPPKPKTKDEYFHLINDYYFLTDPDELIWTHFPNKKQWQLLDKHVSLDEFLSHFYVREQFYLLGMSLTEKSHTNCVLLVDEYHEVRIEFGLPPMCNSTYRFKYTLSHHWSSSWLPVEHQSLLQQGKYDVKDDRFSLTLHLTSDGTYKLDIFGSEQENCDFYLICSYIVKCSYIEEGAALPWKFFLGYGSGVRPQVKTIKTEDGRIKLPFPIERGATIIHVLKSHKGKILDGCSLVRMIDDGDNESSLLTMIIELRLPKPGEYFLRVYEKKNSSCKDLCNYRIIYNTVAETSPTLEGSTAKDSLVSQQNRIIVLSHPGSFIQTNLETVKILFRSEYQLSCKLITHDVSAGAIMKTSVFHNMSTKECQINVSIPTCVDYTLKIFAKFGEEVVSGEIVGQVYEVHSYKIRRVDSDHFPIYGLLDTNRDTLVYIAGTFETHQSVINILQMEITNETLLVLQYQKKASLSSNLVKVLDEGDELNIQVTLPQIGDYLLSLLKKDTATGLIGNVTRYLLRRKQGIEKNNDLQQQKFKEDREEGGQGLDQEEKEENVKEKEMEEKKTQAKKSARNAELKLNQRKVKPILKDDTKIKEMKRLEEETKLPKIDNAGASLISCVDNDVQKKNIDFSENKNITINRPKTYSKSIINDKATVRVDVKKSVQSVKSDQPSKIPESYSKSSVDNRTAFEVDTRKSVESVKSDQSSKMSDPVKKKTGSAIRDNTPKTSKSEKVPSNPDKRKQEPISKNQTDEPRRSTFSESSLLQEVEYAITKCDTELLKSVISRSEKHLGSDILDPAKRLLDVLQAKKDLVNAYNVREKGLLGTALEEARRVNFAHKLDEEIAAAQEIHERLCELDDLRSIIGSFNSRAVSEIKSYSNPPKAVIVVMKSVFLILNVPEEEIMDWKQIRGLLRSIQKPFLRRILHCNPKCVSLESVKVAEVNLGLLRVEDVSCVSEMAKVLFTWVKKIIEEAKNQDLNIDLANLKK